jgi:hypothetical protein
MFPITSATEIQKPMWRGAGEAEGEDEARETDNAAGDDGPDELE